MALARDKHAEDKEQEQERSLFSVACLAASLVLTYTCHATLHTSLHARQ